jgi:hypothetical protein
MAYFELYRLPRERAESRLGRGLAGDATSGEVAVILALNSARVKVVREMIEGDPTLGGDFRQMIVDHIDRATARASTIKHWTVPIPMAVWDVYAAEARRNGLRIGEVLAAALENELSRRGQALDPIERLDKTVRGYQATAAELIGRLERTVEQLSLATRSGPPQPAWVVGSAEVDGGRRGR